MRVVRTTDEIQRPLDTKAVAKLIGRNPAFVRRLVRDGHLEPLPWSRGGWLLFAPGEVDRLLQSGAATRKALQ